MTIIMNEQNGRSTAFRRVTRRHAIILFDALRPPRLRPRRHRLMLSFILRRWFRADAVIIVARRVQRAHS